MFLGIGCLVGVGFAIWDRDRLHSKDHLTSSKQLDIIAVKGGRVPLNPVDLPAIGNPYPSPKGLNPKTPADETPEVDDA